MTLTLAWLRWVGDTQELVLASDSRLGGGVAWDAAPKIMPLDRGDCALAFAGTTGLAYPMMIQIANALRMHRKSMSRALDLAEFKGRAVSIINQMRAHMHSFMHPRQSLGEDETYLLLAGYSWRTSSFAIWSLHYDASIEAFTFRPASPWQGTDGRKMITIVGDPSEEAKKRLRAVLKSRGKLQNGGFDMEPLEVLRDLIREEADPCTGGPIQVVKVYRHMNATPFAVYWPNKESGSLSFLGRPLEAWEEPGITAIDPDLPS